MTNTIRIQVKPNSSRDKVVQQPDGSYIICTRAKPIDGQANAAVIQLLSEHLNIAKSLIRIKNGASGRHKTIIVDK